MSVNDTVGQLVAEGKMSSEYGDRIAQDGLNSVLPEYAIGRLNVSPEDILVLKCNRGPVSEKLAKELRERLRERIGDVRVLIISADIDLSVLSISEIEENTKDRRHAPVRIIDLPVA